MAYDEKEFWGKRYHVHGSSIRAVGRVDLPEEVNVAHYKVAQRQLVELLTLHLGDLRKVSVLDVGFGLGHYARALHEAGVVEYCGIDLASTHHPQDLALNGFEFRHGVDVTDSGLDLGRTFDVVIVLDVLFHIVEQARFDAAIRNICKHAKKKVVVTGLFEDKKLAEHVRHRGIGAFQALGRLSGALATWRDNRIGVFDVLPASKPSPSGKVTWRDLQKLQSEYDGAVKLKLGASYRQSMSISVEAAAYLRRLVTTRSWGTVLEVGSGFSTVVIREAIGETTRHVVVDHDAPWMQWVVDQSERMLSKPRGSGTATVQLDKWLKPGLPLCQGPTLAFLDCGPTYAKRLECVEPVVRCVARSGGGVVVIDDVHTDHSKMGMFTTALIRKCGQLGLTVRTLTETSSRVYPSRHLGQIEVNGKATSKRRG